MSPQTPGFFLVKILAKYMSKIRIVLLFLILVFLFNGPIAAPVLARAKDNPRENKIDVKKLDKRAAVLHAYLAKHNSPLQNNAQDFIDAADAYNLDWRLVASIAGVESTFGKFIPGGYNAWGWGVYGDQAIYFKSWRSGIFTVSEGLRKGYLDKGLETPYEMNRVYAASPTWGYKVNYFLTDIDKFQKQYDINNPDLNGLSSHVVGYSGILALH